ncbi:MAG: FAD-binding oxidoreductase, partial [Proteobacteria bacterium]|nr:FAD-binding oxidoreductase [Pseudomonadota bacterium]
FSEAFSEIIAFIKKHKIQTLFPIEIRFVKADDIWLSPAFHRASVYFAVHTYRHEDHRFYFEGVQEIFKHYQGRPHWGKWHSLKNKDFTRLYPRFEDFKKLRESLDPQGVLLNSYLKEILAS